MLCQALYGRLPDQLPATLEDVIDGSVKTGLDLTPVRAWNKMALKRMVRHGQTNPRRAMPQALLDRLPPWLREQAQVADPTTNPHWLDTLVTAIEHHKAAYWADVEALAMDACPPLALFEQGREWLTVGKELRRVYSQALRQAAYNIEQGSHLTDDERQEAICQLTHKMAAADALCFQPAAAVFFIDNRVYPLKDISGYKCWKNGHLYLLMLPISPQIYIC